MTAISDATLAQIRAADPGKSTWVSANAGSGKTRVLTDRVARLLLKEVPPERVLCLTYTKAAAAHMQNQLFRRLGEWSMLADGDLGERLTELGEDQGRITPEFLRRARTLFASALETPGGLKIQTIHSFCAALLRRFPLEAGISPQFQEMDERSATRLRADVLEAMADARDSSAFDAMAEYISDENVERFIGEICAKADHLARDISRADIWSAFGLTDSFDRGSALAIAFDGSEAPLIDAAIPILQQSTKTMQSLADSLSTLNLVTPELADLEQLCGLFLLKSGPEMYQPKFASLPTKTAAAAMGKLLAPFQALMQRVSDARLSLLSLAAAQKTWALYRFAGAFLPQYARRKQAHGWMDFDDLILRARDLLTDSTMAQWVLFKLDGGIDHILVDEAQDTSPEQWAVIARLAEEFSTGQGARDIERTLFVVGDEKQSIYSFQGADPAAFGKMRRFFADRLEESQTRLNSSELLFSFRSSSAILALVDMVLNKDRAEVSVEIEHKAFFENLPGRVDLWPFLEKPDKDQPTPWFDPVDVPAPNDPSLQLADRIAEVIERILAKKTILPTPKGGRRVGPGDFLILVQRRSDLFHETIKALKTRKLPVAGADRLKIGAELAVRDLAALLGCAATPEDDLSLAAALRSPLFNLSEGELFALAQPRKRSLWEELRNQRARHPKVIDCLNDIFGQADFLRPYELLERILIRHMGRENLIARLGAEAAEGIDAMLSQALQYEQMEPPSLTGFLGWMSTDDSDIKRQMDTKPREIRVMTVHGAKGLEAPIVILPDTAARNLNDTSQIVEIEGGLHIWKTRREDSTPVIQQATEARNRFLEEERTRLLYVAMTRAENWLMVCGAGNRGTDGESWYNRIEAAVHEIGAQPVSFFGQEILRHQVMDWSQPGELLPPVPLRESVKLKEWVRKPAPATVAMVKPLNPSDLGGAKVVGEIGIGSAESEAKRYGRLLHLLLEHLPQIPQNERQARAAGILAKSGEYPSSDEISAVMHEAISVLDNPELGAIFRPGSLAEVELVATFGDRRIHGLVDRLVITPDSVLAVDYKSNADIPDAPANVPEGILRQMGAYAHALMEIYPEHDVKTAILWTKAPMLMPLPNDMVTDALRRATIS